VTTAPVPPPSGSAARALAVGLAMPVAAGAACVLAFAPFYAWPVTIAALAALFFAWSRSGSPRQAALSGFAFGLGYFLTGVSWVYVSLHDFGSMPAILAGLATFLFCAWLAVFPAASGWIAVRLVRTPGPRRLAMAASVFVVMEWVRGWHLTGFPWLELGTSQASASPLAGYAPYLGSYGVSLAVAVAAALLVALLSGRSWSRQRGIALAALAALFMVGALAPLVEWTRPAGPPVSIGLIQGNVPQEMKWREEVRTRTLLEYRRMIFETKARIVVVPETALPAFLDQLPADYLESLIAHARAEGKEVLLGTVEREFRGDEFSYYNSVVRLAPGKMPSYRKRHLVPFGEFIPPGFRWVLAVLKIPMSDFTSGEPRQPPLEAAGVPFGVAICYEDLFGAEVIDALPAARVLLNVSNDAWFGRSFAADQHLQASQMRALETGRWMVRSTNTGASAAIDERGRVVSRLPAFTAGALVEQVTPRDGRTPFSIWGNSVALLLAVLIAFFSRAPRL
jgi:apolipoprotein N-acyltransferase